MSETAERSGRDPIGRALQVLTWLVDSGREHVGVREVAEAMAIAPSSAHRLLKALSEAGFVSWHDADGRYGPGQELLRIALAVAQRQPLQRIAQEHMRELVKACNESSYLGVYGGPRKGMMFGVAVESSHTLRYVIELHKWVPLHAGSSGLAILAFLSPEERTQVYAADALQPVTERTIVEPYKIERECELIRARGYSLTRGQRIRGAVGLAAPVFGAAGAVVGDVCLTIPEHRFDPATETRLATLLMACANDISQQIGGLAHAVREAA